MTAGGDLHAQGLELVEIAEQLTPARLGDRHVGALLRERAGRCHPRDAGADHHDPFIGEGSAHRVSRWCGARIVLTPGPRAR